jgi:murein DD-endopeptidase MepM/ murein hydrolase activator NlpD
MTVISNQPSVISYQKSVIRKPFFCSLITVLCLLTSCTAFHTPQTYLPSKEGIVPGETITVNGNENIYAVARAHNASMRAIIVLNDLQPPFALKPGQKLILPASGSSGMVPVSGGAPVPSSVPSGAVEQTPLAPIQSSSVQTEQLPPPQILLKPGKGSPAVDALNTPTQQQPPQPTSTTVAGAKLGQMAMMAPPPAPEAKAPEEAPSFAASWPVQGPVLSGFGPKGQGLNNDGINIGAPKGAPVLAAASGIVVYAGNEMKGFGNLILIRHQGGWVTAYAHLDRILVNKDAVVAQGDMIGTVGKTGNVPSPQLHFETRYDGKPVDPKSVIKG